MVDGYCRTNLDDYQRYDWPRQFCAVPRIGERVESLCRQHSLKVVGITHCIVTKYVGNEGRKIAGVEIELNK